jgi:hypothetical protein
VEVHTSYANRRAGQHRSAFKDKPCHVNCDCGRFLEIGYNIFREYKKTEQGFEPVPKANVDFGASITPSRRLRSMRFLRAGRAAKYKAKTAIDTFVYRAGDLLQAVLVVAGSHLAFTMRQYALMNVACALISIGVLLAIDREDWTCWWRIPAHAAIGV